MTRSRRSRRTGIVTHGIETTTLHDPQEIAAFIDANMQAGGSETRVARFLDHAEGRALAYLERHDLPAIPGPIQRRPGGDLEPCTEAARDLSVGVEHSWAWVVAEREADPDSEAGFAARLLKATYLTRSALARRPPEPFLVAERMLEVVTAHHDLKLEFGFRMLGAAVKLAPGWSEGGRKRAENRSAESERQRREIEAACEELWSRAPKLRGNRRRTAQLLAPRFKMKPDTLRRKIP